MEDCNGCSGYYSESSNEGRAVTVESDNSWSASHLQDCGLSKDVLDEENKLATETVKEQEELKKKAEPIDNSAMDIYYKKLLVLLSKSAYYSDFILRKLKNRSSIISASNGNAQNGEKSCNKQKRDRKRKINGKLAHSDNKKEGDSKRVMNNSDTYVNELGLKVSVRQPRLLVGAVMRDYQLDGLDWLVALYENAVNGILADEMGLGKTIQVIALISHLFEKQIYGPFLIVAPLSTLPNWMLEFSNFAPKIKVVLYHGAPQVREAVKRQFCSAMMSPNKEDIPVVLTSYELPLRETGFFRKVSWCHVIVDEGHRLKNYKSMLSVELRRYKAANRLLLTGTPLQNNLLELWSLLNFLVPEIFDDIKIFESLFDFSDLENDEQKNRLLEKEKEQQIVSKMHQILEPFLLRRVKSEVNIELPRKKELLVYTPMTLTQEELYKAVLENDVEKYRKASSETEDVIEVNGKIKRKTTIGVNYVYEDNIDEENFVVAEEKLPDTTLKPIAEFCYDIKMLNVGMVLRKIVNHPYLVQKPIDPLTGELKIDQELIKKSGKLLMLDAMLPKLKKRGHKVILFSTFKVVLNLLGEYLDMKSYKYLRLDGECNIEERMESIKQFNIDPDVFVFLISTRAGGLGINLTAADTVIIYDSDWNPQVDLQAQDRCHRLGQTRPVVVYRFVTAGTVDQKIVERATGKRKLEKLIVQDGKFKGNGKSDAINLTELKELLESTDYHKVVPSSGAILSDQELEQLLDRSDLIENKEICSEKRGLFKVIDESFSDVKSQAENTDTA